MNFKIYKSVIYLLFVIALAGCSSKDKQVNTAEEIVNPNLVKLSAEQKRNINLQIDSVRNREISSVLKLSGQIDVPPQNLVSISVPLGGYLKSTNMLPGTKVQKGQLLAIMEDTQYIQLKQDYLSTKSKLVYAQNELNRQKELNSAKAGSDKMLQQAENEYRILAIESKALQEKLQLIGINANKLSEGNLNRLVQIYSPINGYISKVNANIGKYITPADVIFELVDPTDIHLSLNVFEKDLDKIFIGQTVMAYANAKPAVKYETEVILVNHALNTDRSTEIHCHFERYDKTLVPGMYMNADVQVKNHTTATLPQEAIVSFENKNYVFVALDDLNYEMVAVNIGESANGFVDIKTPLANKSIVVKGAYSLLMKLKNTLEEE